YDQMARCYGMPMEEFTSAGYGWVARVAHVEYKRQLTLGEKFIVATFVSDLHDSEVRVEFEIFKQRNKKLCCDGYFLYTMVSLETRRAVPIPEWIAKKYSI